MIYSAVPITNTVNGEALGYENPDAAEITIYEETSSPILLSKKADKEEYTSTEEIIYTIEVQNLRAGEVTDITIIDDFPGDMLKIKELAIDGFQNNDIKNTAKEEYKEYQILFSGLALDEGKTGIITVVATFK